MNKYKLSTFALIAIVILLVVFGRTEYGEYAQAQKIEKERYRKELKRVRDSVETVIKRKDGEILKAIRESALADQVAQESVKEAEKYRKKYEAVKFVAYDSDSARQLAIRSVLKKANQKGQN